MNDAEACDVCGFEWDAITPGEVAPRLAAATAAFAAVLGADRGLVTVRPQAHRWSALEYGAHLRDVLLNVRDRIFVGLAEDDPVTKPMYRELRVPFYASETPEGVAADLTSAAALFVRTFNGLTAEQLARTLVYAYPRVASRSLLWTAAQALHEAEHHLTDARHDVAELSARSFT